jgi:hypothetical protein
MRRLEQMYAKFLYILDYATKILIWDVFSTA